jgi:WD40 repeat protein
VRWCGAPSPAALPPSLLTAAPLARRKGSYDHTVRQWDIGAGAASATWTVPGGANFVQDVCFHPSEPQLFVAATTGKELLLYDVRQVAPRPRYRHRLHDCETVALALTLLQAPSALPLRIPNDAMVNSAIVAPNGLHIISGDKQGALRTWDVRGHGCLSSYLLSESRKTISSLALSPPLLTPRSPALRTVFLRRVGVPRT